MGCFWCGEEAFERYAPGVIEAVSGYTGGSSENPTYRNHAASGHIEAVLVEYDPNKTSYSTLLHYALRNIDITDGGGQFCDRGNSYRPAIFYADEAELSAAKEVLAEIIEENPQWDASTIKVPILERTIFWMAEEYHQNYYIKNPGNYGYYKKACRRSERLKEVWSTEVYECYHDLTYSCFNGTIENSNGNATKAIGNLKETGDIRPAVLPQKIILVASGMILLLIILTYHCFKLKINRENDKRMDEEQQI